MGNEMKAGGYTKYRPVEQADLDVFNEAMEGFVGSTYQPLMVATQVVHGTNYKFICEAKVVAPNATPEIKAVIIHKPLPSDPDTKARITSIEDVY